MQIRAIAVDNAVTALLTAGDLPVDDVDDPTIRFYGAFDGASLVGVVGLQSLDDRAALLRSLAVAPPHRGKGVAEQLCAHVVEVARGLRLVELWLLTTSARDYFAHREFAAVSREHAPASLRTTAQFASLCPSSAIVMRRAL